ncbi:ARM repeat-containing protein [Backusella circina FSU 941]|nr:ARM repeat-containing protein [Backusella circina FSU 941]
MESSSTDILRHKLQESTETIQKLSTQVHFFNMELEKKCITINNFQSIIAGKDLEIQDLEQRLALANQLCESQLIKLNAKQNELNLYHSLAKQPELTLEENSENRKKSTKLHEHPDTSKPLDSKRSQFNENNLLSRRWTDENSTSFNAERKHGYTIVDYRRILDKNVNANWDLFVNRIIQDTDQQASIFLQQKLKSSTAVQKEAIFKSILSQAYLLMTNRFGNFLVQRLFELGTPDQVQELADKMKGHVLELTCEAFGCHVVQKALDYVTEPMKVKLVLELVVGIPETITHRHACHVWQKIFEIRWSPGNSPNIMSNVHKDLKDQWTQVALDETGSLVIQNIFENLTEVDKRPVLNEVLKNIVPIAKGQWGNWVIQHILEQAEKKKDRELAFQTVLDEAIHLSMDQFASKVVEKALRIGGQQFLVKFVEKISTITCSHRPRMALIDIASDQYGNYVVQWLINNANDEQKVHICRLIKRHMVSLRGSKYGQRVAFLVEKVLRNCESPNYATN